MIGMEDEQFLIDEEDTEDQNDKAKGKKSIIWNLQNNTSKEDSPPLS